MVKFSMRIERSIAMRDDRYICTLNRLLKGLEDEISYIKSELGSIKGGKLYIRTRSGRVYFLERLPDGDRGITKNTQRIYLLARRTYLEGLLQDRVFQYKTLADLLSSLADNSRVSCAEAVLKKLSPLDCELFTSAPENLSWSNAPYERNQYKPESLIYETSNGIRMRSKSERYIGNMLEANNIAYRYEAKLQCCGHALYPDFTIKRDDGTIIIWEHLGLLDDSDYAYKTFLKLLRYRQAGFRQHSNLICTDEYDLRSEENVNNIIHRFCISYIC